MSFAKRTRRDVSIQTESIGESILSVVHVSDNHPDRNTHACSMTRNAGKVLAALRKLYGALIKNWSTPINQGLKKYVDTLM